MPSTELRQTVLASARRIVVKMGTQLLTGPDGLLDPLYLRKIAGQVAALRERGVQVTLVSSGAVGAGRAELKMTRRPRELGELQAVAAAGQPVLMRCFHEAFSAYGLKVAQVLLTRDDFDHRGRFLNFRHCITHIHALGCVPIINENDTVTVAGIQEIGFGDNDRLSALVGNALRADALVLLTVVDGLLDAAGQRVDLVTDLDQAAGLARRDTSALGRGGMASKLEAVRVVTGSGEIAVIANGREPDVLPRLFAAEPLGTVFVPATRKLDSRQRWLGLTKRPAGALVVDDGAAAAIVQRGKSLLASGITDATGAFARGALVAICDRAGREIARGLCNYDADEVRLLQGKKSAQFEKILGRPGFAEVVHRDHLVVTGRAGQHGQ